MSITRRSFLYYTGPLSLLPLFPEGCGGSDEYVNAESPFVHGVASGDPLAKSIVLWTRVTGDSGAPKAPSVRWLVALDPSLTAIVAEGVETTDAGIDFTVKVDVAGLRPGRTYYYRFEALGHTSPIGRTRTLPVGKVPRLRLAVTSCSNHPYGYFNAYGAIAEQADLDAVLHLGDYIYEYANGEYGDGTSLGRVTIPNREIVTLEDYRQRHAQYKTDPDLREAHRQHPFITVWDDHESANNAFRDGAENHQPLTEGEWEARKRAAIQAYFEWMPIRRQPRGPAERIYRSFRFGNLVDLVMLDTRVVGRDAQLEDACDAAALADPSRQLLGAEQEAWLVGELADSKRSRTQWRLLGQQVMFAQLMDVLSGAGCVFNTDQWDGYGASRARLLSTLRDQGVDNVVFLTGDIHSSWANDISANAFDPSLYDPATGRGSVAVEFVTPAVTSPGIEDPAQAAGFAALLRQTHPHIKYVELNRRGYLLVDVTPERAQAEWYHLTTIEERTTERQLVATWSVLSGENHLTASTAPSTARSNAPALAPAEPTTTA